MRLLLRVQVLNQFRPKKSREFCRDLVGPQDACLEASVFRWPRCVGPRSSEGGERRCPPPGDLQSAAPPKVVRSVLDTRSSVCCILPCSESMLRIQAQDPSPVLITPLLFSPGASRTPEPRPKIWSSPLCWLIFRDFFLIRNALQI